MDDDKLKDIVELVVADFISDGVVFTALDVSNKVKETMPHARHREVRDQVRQAWFDDIELNGYGRSPITVNLSDGSTVQALLYHPLADSWDLDDKYDVQQRTKTANRPTTTTPTSVGTNSVSNNDPVTPASTPVASTPVSFPVNAKDLWDNMFNKQSSLFPRK